MPWQPGNKIICTCSWSFCETINFSLQKRSTSLKCLLIKSESFVCKQLAAKCQPHGVAGCLLSNWLSIKVRSSQELLLLKYQPFGVHAPLVLIASQGLCNRGVFTRQGSPVHLHRNILNWYTYDISPVYTSTLTGFKSV